MSKNNNKNLKKISYKIILIGNSQVGKTTFFKKLTKKIYSERNISTIGIEKTTFTKIISVPEDPFDSSSPEEEIEFSIEFFDTAGQERYRAITSSYFKNAQGLLLFYDITNKKSFEDHEIWLNAVIENLGEKTSNSKKSYSLLLIGNKKDLEDQRQVTKEEAIEICEKMNIGWGGEISIKDLSFEELEKKFSEMVKHIYKDIGNQESNQMVTKKLAGGEKKKKKNNNNQLCC